MRKYCVIAIPFVVVLYLFTAPRVGAISTQESFVTETYKKGCPPLGKTVQKLPSDFPKDIPLPPKGWVVLEAACQHVQGVSGPRGEEWQVRWIGRVSGKDEAARKKGLDRVRNTYRSQLLKKGWQVDGVFWDEVSGAIKGQGPTYLFLDWKVDSAPAFAKNNPGAQRRLALANAEVTVRARKWPDPPPRPKWKRESRTPEELQDLRAWGDKQPANLRDCGEDMNCLVEAAKTCAPARARKQIIVTPIPNNLNAEQEDTLFFYPQTIGILATLTGALFFELDNSFEIKGRRSDGSCILDRYVGDIDLGLWPNDTHLQTSIAIQEHLKARVRKTPVRGLCEFHYPQQLTMYLQDVRDRGGRYQETLRNGDNRVNIFCDRLEFWQYVYGAAGHEGTIGGF